jgi:hypothetical protein
MSGLAFYIQSNDLWLVAPTGFVAANANCYMTGLFAIFINTTANRMRITPVH